MMCDELTRYHCCLFVFAAIFIVFHARREISPGFFLGRLYAKPFSYCDRFNPLPYPYFVLHFAVFQAPIITEDQVTDIPIQGFSGPHL